MRSARLILCLCLLVSGCHKHVPIVALPPAPPPTPPPAPIFMPSLAPAVPPPLEPPPVAPLSAADRAFNAGNYDESARAYEEYLRNNASGKERDQALFYLGLSYALRPAPAADWTKAGAAFKELVDAQPQSQLRLPANLILSMRAELDQSAADSKQRDQKIKQLTTELDRLKKIDADRRKKP